jgi:PAS domain S-box-containing protein
MLIAIDNNGNVSDVNKKGCEILGYKEAEIIGKNWFDNFVSESVRERLKAGLREIIGGNPNAFRTDGNFSIISKGGKERLIAWHNAVLTDENNNIIGTLSSGEDITDRKKMEEELQKIEKLESIGTLAGGIAHDFNNILTAILGNISLAMAQSPEHTPLFSVLQEAEKASLRARELTLQLLTFSRGGAPVKKMVPLAELIRESSSFALRGSKVKGEFLLDKDLWDIEADEGQINQVLHNLVKNAVEAMPDGGVAHISAVNKLVAESGDLPLAPGKYVHISVTDSGTGISQKNLDRMFEPFFTTKPKGSGLGLATSYSIIKNHGGFIGLESVEGRGATFNVYLPASEKHASAKKETITHHTIKGKGKILVMDDEDMILTMLGSILKVAGYTSVLVSDGAEAVRQYVNALKSKAPFDAVIMDLTIPGGMGGKEAIMKLLEKDPAVKVIVSSGYATDPIMAEYEDYGFSAVVTKPYTADQIEKTLRNLLKKKN